MPRQKLQNQKSKAKVVAMHSEEDTEQENETILQQAAVAEKNNDLELAEKLYKKQMKQKAFNPFVYTRLMIIYRKEKNYTSELEIINKGLQHFEEESANRSALKAGNATIKKLSKSLNRSLGLTDSKGKILYEPEPIPTWKKRRETVKKKLKK